MVRVDNTNLVAVGTIDIDTTQYGGVYLLEENTGGGGTWLNTSIGSYDIYRVAFSINYSNDRQLIAVASNETDTYIMSKIHNGTWGQMINNARISGIVPVAANIAFPNDYNGLTGSTFFTGISTGVNSGDVYRIAPAFVPGPSSVTDLNVGTSDGMAGTDVASLSMSGNTIIAGGAGTASIYLSNDSGQNWKQCNKPPTGQFDVCVLIAPEFDERHRVYAVTRGIESAFSYSDDGGVSWDQISLIDTRISNITDFSNPVSSAIFMLTFNAENLKHSLWRTIDGGNTWDRIFSSSFISINELKSVEAIPKTDSATVVLSAIKNGSPIILRSDDNGRIFSIRPAPGPVDTWSIVDSETFFIER